MNPRHSRAHALQQEKPVHWRATPTRESPCVTVIPSAARKREKIEKKGGGMQYCHLQELGWSWRALC